MSEGGLLTLAEVQQKLHVGQTTAYALIASGQLPHLRLGRAIRVRPESLARFLAALEVTGVGDAEVVPIRITGGRRGR
ncbi:MAG TPA: helix-turn-helix domain-containing protein [Candidatus Acidoferrales bacterium]|nr:helix-turn-helix domain-containing protein [Candidatus Acidoferrales bacterium]